MLTKNIVVLALLIIITPLSPNIITSSRIADVHEHSTKERTLVLFDLDQTVFEVTGPVHEHWFSHMFNHARSIGHDDESALKAVLPLYYNIMSQAPGITPAEPSTVEVIKQLQARGIPVMGLTARGAELTASTQTQLNKIGINFKTTSLTPYDITFPMARGAAKLEGGILFCGPSTKGDALKALLDGIAYKPTKIVFVDDKEHHLKSVMNMALSAGIEFVGIRYAHLDEKMHAYVLDAESKQQLKPPATKTTVELKSLKEIQDYIIPGCMVLANINDVFEETNNSSAAINALQEAEVTVLGLSAQQQNPLDETLQRLQKLDIDFTKNAPLIETLSFPIGHPNIFLNGVLFCKDTNTEALTTKAFLKYHNHKPTRIIILDGQAQLPEDVATAIISLGIDCFNVRCTPPCKTFVVNESEAYESPIVEPLYQESLCKTAETNSGNSGL